MLTRVLGPAAFIITGGQEATNIVLSLLFSAAKPRAQHPGVSRTRGSQGKQSCQGGEGKDPPLPLTPVLG